MSRRSREEEIIGAIRKFLIGAVKRIEPITDTRLMEAANCARATFYKYVTMGSDIRSEINVACTRQKAFAELASQPEREIGHDLGMRKRLDEAEEGNRVLLAYISRMTMNLMMRGVEAKVIQAAQRESMPHPNRSYSRAGRGRRGT